jgi:hypothetical protein
LGAIARQASDSEQWTTHWLYDELEGRRGALMPDAEGQAESYDTPALRPDLLYSHYVRLLRAWFELHELGQATVSSKIPYLGDASTISTDHRETIGRTVFYRLELSDDVERLRQRLANVTLSGLRIAKMANLLEVQRRYKRLVCFQLPFLGGFALISTLSLLCFASIKEEVPITAPLQVVAAFQEDTKSLEAAGLPKSCAGLTINGVAVNGTLSTPEVSSIDPRCHFSHVTLTTDVGIIEPLPTGK